MKYKVKLTHKKYYVNKAVYALQIHIVIHIKKLVFAVFHAVIHIVT